MFRVIEDLLLLYFLYKLIFDFIIPAATTTKQVKKQFSEMQSKMQEQAEQYNQQQSNYSQPANNNQQQFSKPADKDDYIEFEEIK